MRQLEGEVHALPFRGAVNISLSGAPHVNFMHVEGQPQSESGGIFARNDLDSFSMIDRMKM